MSTPEPAAAQVAGRVLVQAGSGSGTGVAGVAVSDGLTVTRTDAEGRYTLRTDPQRRRTGLVHITVPAGYSAPAGEFAVPEFYRRVALRPGDEVRADFTLRPDPLSADEDYRFVAMADVHVQAGAANTKEGLTSQLEQITSLAGQVDPVPGPPRFITVAGDLTNDATTAEFQDYLSAIASSSVPVWSAPGNHDLVGRTPGGAARESGFPGAYRDTVDRYRRMLGPEWYSFQYGSHHYVVLENYLGLAQRDQLHWLEQDLATNAIGKQVVVITHVPWDVPQTPAPAQTTPYLELFRNYDVRLLLAGHTHTNDVSTGIVGGAVQAVTTSAAASQDQTPRGFRLVSFADGSPSLDFGAFDAHRSASVVHPTGVVPAGATRVWVDRYQPPGVRTEVQYRLDSAPWRALGQLGRRTWAHDVDLAGTERRLLVRARDSSGDAWSEHETTLEAGTDRSAATAATPRQGEPWPMFHADAAHTGVTADVVRPPLRPAWITHAGGTVLTSSPALAHGTVFLGVRDEDGMSGNGVLAIGLADGRTRWRTTTPGAVDASVAVAGDVVLAPSTRGPLHALDVATGRSRWEWRPEHAGDPHCWMYYSPTVADDVVYQAYSVSSGTWAVALDVKSAEVRWCTTEPLGRNWFTYAAPAVSDDLLVFATAYANLIALDADTGKLRWQNTLGAGLGVRAKPVLAGGLVLLPGQGDALFAVDAGTGTVSWTYRAAGDSRIPGAGTAATPAVADGVAYTGFTDGSVVALDLHSGAEIWRYQADGAVQSSPAVSGETVYVGSHDGRIRALDRRSGACRWHHDLGSWVVSSPVVTGNAVVTAAWSGIVCAFTEDAA